MVGEHHMNEAQQIQADRLTSDDRGVAVNHAAVFQLPQPLLEAGARQFEAPRQRRRGGAGIALQVREQLPVQAVD